MTWLERALRILLVLGGLAAFAACARLVRDIFFPRDPSVPNAQLRSFANQLSPGQTRAQVEALASRFDQLSAFGARSEKLIVATPGRFDADNWLAHIYFDSNGKIASVSFGTTDAAPLRPRYPAPAGMPEDRCFGASPDCEGR